MYMHPELHRALAASRQCSLIASAQHARVTDDRRSEASNVVALRPAPRFQLRRAA